MNFAYANAGTKIPKIEIALSTGRTVQLSLGADSESVAMTVRDVELTPEEEAEAMSQLQELALRTLFPPA